MNPSKDTECSFGIEAPEELQLTPSQKHLCDRYIAEYLTDFDWYDAAVRVGYPEAHAKDYAMKFKHNAYVLRRIQEAKRAEPHCEEVETTQKRQVINALLKEAQYNGPGASHGARVSALAKLTSVMGMDAPTKSESTVTHEGEASIKHSFEFEEMDPKDLSLVRQLLTNQVAKEDAKADAIAKGEVNGG